MWDAVSENEEILLLQSLYGKWEAAYEVGHLFHVEIVLYDWPGPDVSTLDQIDEIVESITPSTGEILPCRNR